jgi:CubicO group peptidase (beta-lactamase class C family)
MDKRQVKLGIYGFLVVLFVSMLSIKPYLPRALYHNFAKIDDYRFFDNRVIAAKLPGEAWPSGEQKMADPDPQTQKLLKDLGTTALLVLENGKIVYEKYDLSGGPEVISGSFSMAKSIIALLYGFALQEGRIKSLNEPISNYLTEWEGTDEGKITIRNLLTMSSGLNWQEAYSNPFSITTEAYYGSNLHMTALRQRSIEPQGTHFVYQSGSTQLLGLVLGRAVNMNLANYASAKLWKPLGAEKDALWSLDHEDGMEKAYCCVNARARDFARLGELVRLDGKWHDQQLLNSNYIHEMLTPNQLPDDSGKPIDYYGYQWWILSTPQGNVPYMRGILGQYVVVVPQKNRVVVRLGMKSGKQESHHPEEIRALVQWALGR